MTSTPLELPLVSIVTPSLNMGRFIEETIQSVLAQDYPRIEYLVMDGGSTDGTLEILERYKGRLRYQSAPDRGTADAINRGFALSSGSIQAWLSADDLYMPGAVRKAVAALAENPHAAVVYGGGIWVDEDGKEIGAYPTHACSADRLAQECIICQPAAFIRREVFQRVGGLDPGLDYSFDYELWMRIAKLHPLVMIPGRLAAARMHADSKSLGRKREMYTETLRVLKQHFGYVPFQWVYGYACLLVDRRDQFFQPFQPSVPGFLMSLLLGLRHNHRQPIRFLGEWLSALRFA